MARAAIAAAGQPGHLQHPMSVDLHISDLRRAVAAGDRAGAGRRTGYWRYGPSNTPRVCRGGRAARAAARRRQAGRGICAPLDRDGRGLRCALGLSGRRRSGERAELSWPMRGRCWRHRKTRRRGARCCAPVSTGPAPAWPIAARGPTGPRRAGGAGDLLPRARAGRGAQPRQPPGPALLCEGLNPLPVFVASLKDPSRRPRSSTCSRKRRHR